MLARLTEAASEDIAFGVGKGRLADDAARDVDGSNTALNPRIHIAHGHRLGGVSRVIGGYLFGVGVGEAAHGGDFTATVYRTVDGGSIACRLGDVHRGVLGQAKVLVADDVVLPCTLTATKDIADAVFCVIEVMRVTDGAASDVDGDVAIAFFRCIRL